MKKQKGFSLIELMIVIGIIALLATLALPRFQAFQWRARQSEAKNTLNHIYTLEEAYRAANAEYTLLGTPAVITIGSQTCNESNIGFNMPNCNNAFYQYWVENADANSFSAFASETAGRVCGKNNRFRITQDHSLSESNPC